MAKERIRQAIGLISDFLKNRNIRVEKILVFGSYAAGDYRKDSDVDVAIISQDFEEKDIFQRADMLKGLEWSLAERFMLPFDIIPISLKEWKGSFSLTVEFVKEGKSLSL